MTEVTLDPPCYILQDPPHDLVAIKCIGLHRLTDRSKENLLVEIRLMKELHHPHIVKMFDFVVS